MKITISVVTLKVGSLSTNCYLINDIYTNNCIILDPGDDADYIISTIQKLRLKPQSVIATHGHFDHILAVTELKLAYKVPFYIHMKDKFLVSQMSSSAKYFLKIDTDPPPEIDGFLSNQQEIKFGRQTLKVIETPGHTPGSVCLYNKENKILFTGDLLFADGGVGRTDFSYSNLSQLNHSISQILKFPLNTKLFPGHGMQSDIKKERIYH